ncbi:siderophore-interacting protein [Amorphus coralli]|uniref:siderophore-interacting protein n=1 Tax=Amorphus coralli TaxID=340680 RepID=UPI00037E2E8D|nr:siderophore-interacting protein [Amorphus coralli]
MSEGALLVSSTHVPLPDPPAMMVRLCDHLKEHAEVAHEGETARVTSFYGSATVAADDAGLSFQVESSSVSHLFVMKSVISEHLHSFSDGETLAFTWTGDGETGSTIPYFREMMVLGSQPLTPRMQRVILKGDAAFYDAESFHIRVLVPPRGRRPVWPWAAPDGRTMWPKGEDELLARVYTVRSVDLARGEIALDVVVHDGAPGSDWATSAEPGSVVGILGPGGGGMPPAADHMVLAGDETALPAIARMLEMLPEGQRASVRLEVADAAEAEAHRLTVPAGVDLEWLSRDGAPAGSTDLLETAIRGLDWDALPKHTQVWCACEQATARKIRRFLDKERGFARTERVSVAYWRIGATTTLAD